MGLHGIGLKFPASTSGVPWSNQDDFFRIPDIQTEQICDHVAAIHLMQHFVPGEAPMSHPGESSVCVNATSTIKYTHVSPGNHSSHSRVARR